MAEFKNPNQGGGGGGKDSQSLMVMLLVMFVGVLGYMWWQNRNQPPQQPTQPQTSQSAPAQQLPPLAAPTTSAATPSTAPVANTPTVQAAAVTTTTVENELYKITFSNRGGQVIHWIIKHCGGGNPQPVCTDDHGQPLDLVHAGASKLYGYPLSLYTYDPALRQNLAQALYVPSVPGVASVENATLTAPATLTYNYAYGGYVVRKTFSFGNDYVIHADTELTLNGAPIRALLAWPAAFGDMETTQGFVNEQVDLSTAGKDTHDAPKNVVGGVTTTRSLDFAGVSDQYFAAIFMPDQPQDATLVSLQNLIKIPSPTSGIDVTTATAEPTSTTKDLPKGSIALPVLGAAVGSTTGHNQLRLFVGPKALPVLKSINDSGGGNLGPVLDFGFWTIIAKPLYYALHFVQEHMASNWGWAIILFTTLINVIILPLRIQGMRSALKMQRIQPQVDAIKAKYKNPGPTDPKAGDMNAEIMAFQKTQGVSMFGGCLPSLIPMPMLIAFFYMMNKIVELRHAHWFYLHDLSKPDPYHILPIMMFLTSFLAQYFTPSPGVDPAQQKMMAFMMPVFSAYLTWSYASALGIYWNVGNLIMIAQQQIMNRTSLGREIRQLQLKRAKRPAATPQKSAPNPKIIPGRR